ncbi:MAG TPA: SemiSWEET transporter [Geobacteraceae bacterium]|jgi:MtN3 and saliva related transmembrane protein|nr:SemiSWEET transporter [Geobacteraceae bacterium]
MNATYLGLLAGTLTSVATIPQVVMSYRTRHVRDISIWQPLLLAVGTALWLTYGIILGDVPLIVANAFSIVCNSMLICMKIVYGDDEKVHVSDYVEAKIVTREEI